MFDLKKYKDEILNKNNLLKYINPYDVYYYYLGDFTAYKSTNSPFRKDDNPSFGIFLSATNELIFNDYKLGGGDFIKFVSLMENCSYKEAMSILNKRYNVNLIDLNKPISSTYTKPPLITNKTVEKKSETWINIIPRKWQLHDKQYWSQYEISKATLEYFDVSPISKFFINQYGYKAHKYAYAYYYEPSVYKIYQPYLLVKDGKFWSNIKNSEIYQGVNQLPDSGELLFITSSLKDVMVLYEAGFSGIAPHTEHQILSEGLFSYYKSKWDLMIVLYDNDEAGILHANKMVDKFKLKSLVLPESDTKDPSDFVKKYDLSTLKDWILNNL